MTSTALALHGSHGIDTEKPHVEVYQCQCLEYIMLFVADKTHVTATNNMKENTKERIVSNHNNTLVGDYRCSDAPFLVEKKICNSTQCAAWISWEWPIFG